MTMMCNPSPDCGNSVILDTQKKQGETQDSIGSSAMSTKHLQASKEFCQSVLSSVNKSALHIKKLSCRNPSPLNWFPRKKTDSFLSRKIRLLQERGGMPSSLNETLGNAIPHYSRVEREKIAVREAACKVTEALKIAMVEASWCRMLKVARISSAEADNQFANAEKTVEKTIEEAAALGVIMRDRHCCSHRSWETRSGSNDTVSTSFETAFEVDKEVATAVKKAFLRLANESASSVGLQNLWQNISHDPGIDDTNFASGGLTSMDESDFLLESDSGLQKCGNGSSSEVRERKDNNGPVPLSEITKTDKLANMMLDRLKCLHEKELASIASVVATWGLTAVLQVDNEKHNAHGSTADFRANQHAKAQEDPPFPTLDKFLVKHVSRLEREVQDAKNARSNQMVKNGAKENDLGTPTPSEQIPNLGNILVIKHTSRLEKEIKKAKELEGWSGPSEDKLLNGRLTARPQNENHAKSALSCNRIGPPEASPDVKFSASAVAKLPRKQEVETTDSQGFGELHHKHVSMLEGEERAAHARCGLTEIVLKPLSHPKMEKQAVTAQATDHITASNGSRREAREKELLLLAWGGLGLENHIKPCILQGSRTNSRELERGEAAMQSSKLGEAEIISSESQDKVFVKHNDLEIEENNTELSVRHCSRSEAREQFVCHANPFRRSRSQQEARESGMLEAWGGLDLSRSLKPHLSRLERDKEAWKSAEEEKRKWEIE